MCVYIYDTYTLCLEAPPALWEVAIMNYRQLTLMLKIVWQVRKFGGLYFKHAIGKTI
jgi:hypothetical protein